MNTTLGFLRAFGCLSGVAAALAATGCSSTGSEKSAASASQALTQSEVATLTQDGMKTVFAASGVQSSTLAFSSSPLGVSFTPSAAFLGNFPALRNLGDAGVIITDAGAGGIELTLPIPPMKFTPSGAAGTLCGQLTVTPTSFQLTGGTPANSLGAVDVALGSNGFSLSGISFNASFVVDSGSCPDFDLNINGATLGAVVAWNAGEQMFNVSSITATLPTTVSNCLFGACNSLVEGALPDLQQELVATLTTDFNGLFFSNQAAIASGFANLIAAYWNLPAHRAATGSPWIPNSVSGATADIGFTAGPPAAVSVDVIQGYGPPPACTYSYTCGNPIVKVGCTLDALGSTDPIVVSQEVLNNAAQEEVFEATSAISPSSTTVMGTFDMIGSASSATFIGCTEYLGGQACDAPQTIACTPACVPVACAAGACGPQANGCGGINQCGACPPIPPISSCGTAQVCCEKAHGKWEPTPPPAKCVIE